MSQGKRYRGRAASIAGVLALLCSLSAHTGQASTPAHSSDSGVTISVAYSANYLFDSSTTATVWWKHVKTQFEARYPGTHLRLIGVGGTDVDEVDKVNLMLRAPTTSPDVLSIPTSPVGAMAASGYLAPLNRDVATWPTWKDFPAAVRAENTVGGQVWAINTGNNDNGLLYDVPYFKKAGIAVPWHPRTWADILSAARKIKAAHLPNVHPVWWVAGKEQGSQTVIQGTANLLVGTRQPAMFDARTKKWVVRSQGLLDTFQFYHTLAAEQLGPPLGDISTPQGMVVFAANWLYHQRYAIAVAANWVPGTWLPGMGGIPWPQGRHIYAATAIPTEYGQAPGIATAIGGWAYAITAASRHKDLAWKLITLMEESANSISMGNESGLIPPAVHDASSKAITDFLQPYNAIYNPWVAVGTTLPAGPAFPKYIEALNDTTGQLIQNPGMSAQQAQDFFAAEATQLIGADSVETTR